jgi:hypothetical protein
MQFVPPSLRRFVALLVAVFAMAASAAVVVLDAAPASALDCGTQIGYSPGCYPQNRLEPMLARGYLPGSHGGTYCVVQANYQAGPISVAAKLLGHKSGKFVRIRSGKHKQLCRPMPAHGCPKISIRSRSGDTDTNLGLYPTCGVSLKLPTDSKPYLRLCATNPANHRQKLELDYGNSIGMTVRAKAHQRVCVVRSFAKKQRQKIRVLWNNGDFNISLGEIQTYAWFWRLGG